MQAIEWQAVNKEESSEERTLAAMAACPPRYRIKQILGRGGMGLVFKAFDQQLSRDVAIKILWTEGHCDDSTRMRFMREAKALSVLKHPNVVQIFSSDLNEKGYPYHVMEFVEGETLAFEISRAKMSAERFYKVFSQIASGLQHAHEHGVAHRDLKPSNIMITSVALQDEEVDVCKIIDFGIARFELSPQQAANTITRTEAFLGSPLYMSPEQCRAERGDYRSDIYMLGCIMFECLRGKPPFTGENSMEIMYKHMSEAPPDLQCLAKSKESKRLASLIHACMQKDPEARPKSMSFIAEELKQTFGTESPCIDLFEQKASPRKGKTRILIIALLSALVLGLALLFAVLSLRKEEKPGSVMRTLEQKVEEKIAESKLKLSKRTEAAFPEKLKLLFELGRWQLKSSSIQDLADAEHTFNQALSLCQKHKAPADRLAACFVLRGKAKWKQEKAAESNADFEQARKLIQTLENPEQDELLYDFYEELIIMHIHQRRFSEVSEELKASSDCWDRAHPEKGLGLMDAANQQLDPKGEERRQLFRNCAEELQKQKPKSEQEAIQLARLALVYSVALAERSYRQPPSATRDMLKYAQEILDGWIKEGQTRKALQKELDKLEARRSK